MSDPAIHVAKIVSFDDAGTDVPAVLKLADGATLLVPRTDRRFPVWARMIGIRKGTDGPVYVEADATMGTVRSLLLPCAQRIQAVADRLEGDRLNVVLFMAPALYHLKTTGSAYAELRRKAEDAFKDGSMVLVTTSLDTQEILDIRVLERTVERMSPPALSDMDIRRGYLPTARAVEASR